MAFTRNQRSLVIVNSLSKNFGGLWKLFYRLTEAAAILVAKLFLSRGYREIIVVRGMNATTANFLSALRTAAHTPGVETVDVFLQVHGKPGMFCFYDADLSSAALREAILNLNLPAGRLRLIYNTGCYGDSQNCEDMLTAGFATAIGARKVNATGTTEFPMFCLLWRLGASVQQIMRAADHGVLRGIQDAIARILLPSSEIDSRKLIRGRNTLRISEPYGDEANERRGEPDPSTGQHWTRTPEGG